MDAIAAILAGGRSAQMGEHKATMLLRGTPLIEYPVQAAKSAGLEPWVLAKPGTELPPLDCRIIEEPEEPVDPLAGIVTALEADPDRPVIAVGADMPFLGEWLIAWLATQPVTTVTQYDGTIHPLLARYEHRDAKPLRVALDRGEPAEQAVAALHPKIVADSDLIRFGDPHMLTFSVNTPADLAEAEAIAASRPAA